MVIYQLGWHWKHKADLCIERPNGHFGTQLILVQSKGRLLMGENEFHVEKNTVFIVQSCVPHCIYGDGEEYCDDWIRFSIEKEDVDFIDSLGLRFNVPVKLGDDSISELVHACDEIFHSEIPKKNDTLDHLLRAILLHTSRYCCPEPNEKHNYYDIELEKIRRDIYGSPAREWNVIDMAEKLNISPSHFQRLYKSRYGISCMKDVWTSRMEYAKQLLLNTDLSAKEISYMCGYQNYEHFSRSFVKYACVSPVRYRSKFKE
ncbi:MAG: helix-turn-helix transcriptional regulator [Ruminococcus sp.]|nr:helix-turn-helix transcriptional regulator [Ruminococcus sp.]